MSYQMTQADLNEIFMLYYYISFRRYKRYYNRDPFPYPFPDVPDPLIVEIEKRRQQIFVEQN
jgi:hypothetical protein